MKTLVNFILFQVGWFACVISAASQMEWLALISVGGVMTIHLFLINNRMPELHLILTAGVIGFALDSILVTLGVFNPVNQFGFNGIAPLWLVSLWMLFSITLNHSLSWLHGRYASAALLGFVFAPVAYLAGQRLGALHFPADQSHFISLLIIGCCWLVVTPLLLLSAQLIARQKARHKYS